MHPARCHTRLHSAASDGRKSKLDASIEPEENSPAESAEEFPRMLQIWMHFDHGPYMCDNRLAMLDTANLKPISINGEKQQVNEKRNKGNVDDRTRT